MVKVKLTKAEKLLVLHILKRRKDSIDTDFVWLNPLTYFYLAGSMIKIGFEELFKSKK